MDHYPFVVLSFNTASPVTFLKRPCARSSVDAHHSRIIVLSEAVVGPGWLSLERLCGRAARAVSRLQPEQTSNP